MWGKRSSYSLQILNDVFEGGIAISHKIKFTHTIRPGIHKKEKFPYVIIWELGGPLKEQREKKKKNNQQHRSLKVVEIP